MKAISDLWYSKSEADWKSALDSYWNFVRPNNKDLEKELDNLKLKEIREFDKSGWYDFLLNKYFRWKYTAPNRYATTTLKFNKYKERNQLDNLFDIKLKLLNFNVSDISEGLMIAKEIHGLGIAGASGLLSLMYPDYFATVDQFVVEALDKISGLSKKDEIHKMMEHKKSLTLNNGIVLINIMRGKASENNQIFNTDFWTPRKIDKVLWSSTEARSQKFTHSQIHTSI